MSLPSKVEASVVIGAPSNPLPDADDDVAMDDNSVDELARRDPKSAVAVSVAAGSVEVENVVVVVVVGMNGENLVTAAVDVAVTPGGGEDNIMAKNEFEVVDDDCDGGCCDNGC